MDSHRPGNSSVLHDDFPRLTSNWIRQIRCRLSDSDKQWYLRRPKSAEILSRDVRMSEDELGQVVTIACQQPASSIGMRGSREARRGNTSIELSPRLHGQL